MCGIVGLFLKDQMLQPKLGAMLADMLAKLGDRGPDSAGLAIYSGADDGVGKLTVQSTNPAEDFPDLSPRRFPKRSARRSRSRSGIRMRC